MRNVWKGLAIGGLTGVAGGVILDSLAGVSKKAAEIGGQVRGHAPEAGRWMQSATDKAGEWLHDAEVPDHVRTVARKIKDSDVADRLTEMGGDLVSSAKDKIS
jgi:hypothetical protein